MSQTTESCRIDGRPAVPARLQPTGAYFSAPPVLDQTTTHDPIPAGATYDVHGAMGPAGSRLDVRHRTGYGGRVAATATHAWARARLCLVAVWTRRHPQAAMSDRPEREAATCTARGWPAPARHTHIHMHGTGSPGKIRFAARRERTDRVANRAHSFRFPWSLGTYNVCLLPRSCLQQSYESAVSCRAGKESRKHSKSAVCTRGVSYLDFSMEWNGMIQHASRIKLSARKEMRTERLDSGGGVGVGS